MDFADSIVTSAWFLGLLGAAFLITFGALIHALLTGEGN